MTKNAICGLCQYSSSETNPITTNIECNRACQRSRVLADTHSESASDHCKLSQAKQLAALSKSMKSCSKYA